MNDRPFDLLVYGATGLTGSQAVAFLSTHAPAGLKLAIGGRRAEALAQIAARTPRELGIVVADAHDREGLDALAASARVVLSTAGPFALHGGELFGACVRQGTHYADITGETPWVREMIDRWEGEAVARGVAMVPFAGFDSVPSDLGVWMLAEAARERDTSLGRVQAAFAMRGGLNGGTLASVLAMAEEGVSAALDDPWLLSPPEAPRAPEFAPNLTRPRWDPRFQRWLTPFFMAPVNTRVVRRSAALAAAAGRSYGARFAYDEALETRSRGRAYAVALGSGLGPRALAYPFVRRWARRLGPAPGEGPDEKARESGFFRARFWAETEDRRLLGAVVADRGDPGNAATVKMLSAVGLGLAESPPSRGGVLTPSAALGADLQRRLAAWGMHLEVVDGLPADVLPR